MPLRLHWLQLAVLLTTVALPATVEAQAWLADRARTEGRGLRAGDLEFHPGVGAEIGYDSNVFLASDTADEPAEGSAILRIAPHLYVATRKIEEGPPPAVKLRAGVGGSLKHYFETDQKLTLSLAQDLKFTVNPDRPFSAELRESYQLSQDPFTGAAAPGTGSGGFEFDRHQFSVGPYLQVASPGGLLKWGLGYTFGLDFFTDPNFEGNDTMSHGVYSDASWEFLPKTALFWEGRFGLRDYTAESPPASVVDRNDSRAYKTRLGLNGGLTPTVGLTLAAGYGAGIFDDGDDYENVIGQAELRWRPSATSGLLLGYEREASSSFQGNFTTLNRIKTGASAMFGGVFALGWRGELTFVDYGFDDTIAARRARLVTLGEDVTGVDPNRNDIHLMLNLSGEYRFTDWLGLTAELGYLTNITDFAYPPAIETDMDTNMEMAVGTPNPAEYQRIEAWLGVRAFF